MPVHNSDIARMLNEVADLLAIEGANHFRVRAYRDAASTISRLPDPVSYRVEAGEDLTDLHGIGEDLAGKIAEIVHTGHLQQLDALTHETPSTLADLMQIPGLGAKRVQALHDALGITTRDGLLKAARQGKIRQIPGFGAKIEEDIRTEIERSQGKKQRILLSVAEEIVIPLVDYLKAHDDVQRVAAAGSYRRRQETVGDLDIVVMSTAGHTIADYFTRYDDVMEVVSSGDTRVTVLLRSGLHADLRIVPGESWGAALFYLTGSRDHNLALRRAALDRGLKVNEYGIFKGDTRIAGRTEEEFYSVFDLPWIPPELRENRGEIEAARAGALPHLITLDDIRGNLHTHTDASDGQASLGEMAHAARERGYRYLAITDHSPHITVTHGLDANRLARQIDEIDRLNEKMSGITLLKGVEVDILEDGSLDLPDSILARLDLVVCSVHSYFKLSRDKQTGRIIRALDNPYVTILAHPTGRRLDKRAPYEVDMERVMQAALERGCYLELNAQPNRLDLDDIYCKMAHDMGLKIAISTDAHRVADLDFMRFGIDQARRGWIEANDVLNTRHLSALKRLLARS